SDLPYPHSFPTRRSSDLKLVRQHLEQHPFLKKHPDFVEFLEQYAGARVFTLDGSPTPGFFHATIYGVGDWDFADECPSPVTSERSEEHTSELQSRRDLVC